MDIPLAFKGINEICMGKATYVFLAIHFKFKEVGYWYWESTATNRRGFGVTFLLLKTQILMSWEHMIVESFLNPYIFSFSFLLWYWTAARICKPCWLPWAPLWWPNMMEKRDGPEKGEPLAGSFLCIRFALLVALISSFPFFSFLVPWMYRLQVLGKRIRPGQVLGVLSSFQDTISCLFLFFWDSPSLCHPSWSAVGQS